MRRLYRLQGSTDAMIGVALYLVTFQLLGIIHMSDWMWAVLFTVTFSLLGLYTLEVQKYRKRSKRENQTD